MLRFSGSRVDVALFVVALVEHSKFAYRSITIIPQGLSEAYFVLSVTDTSSEDIAKKLAPIYSLRRMNTL